MCFVASQTWTLARFLPLLIGDKIPESHPHYENFLLHLQIINAVFAPVTATGRASLVRELIAEHHEKFGELYPGRFTPKMHYNVHLPQWMIRSVPHVPFDL